jgi:heptosyltransferase-2
MKSEGNNSNDVASPKLLIVKFGAIGDVVMAIPGAWAMHCTGYSVEWLCSETVAPVLRLYPWIKTIAVDDRKLLQGSAVERLTAMLGLWRRLAGKRYDVCATLYYDRRYRLLTLPVRAKRKVMLSKLDRATQLLPGRHHTDEYARILLGRADTETPRQLAPVRAEGLPANPLPHVAGKRRIVIVAAGARNTLRDDALRRWPVESYVLLAQTLLAAGHEVVLAGGADDKWASEHFRGLAVTDVTATLSLVEMLALLDSADVTVTHDTGPLHLAGLTSTAIVTIFGPTDPHGRLPQRANCVALWGGEGYACRPCYDGRGYADCSHNGCIREITPAMVAEQVEQLLVAGVALAPRVIESETQSLVTIAVSA